VVKIEVFMHRLDQKYLEWKNVLRTYTRENLQEIYEKYVEIFRNETVPVIWHPDAGRINASNIGKSIRELNFKDYRQFFNWASGNREEFWKYVVTKLGIRFSKEYEEALDLRSGVEYAQWFRGASLNIVESCFLGRAGQAAIIVGREGTSELIKITYSELQEKVEKVAGGLAGFSLQPGDRVVLYAPLSAETVISYLALIKIGVVPVSVADSFSSLELKKRIEFSKAKAVITTFAYSYGGKKLAIYEKVKEATTIPAIVFGEGTETRADDVPFDTLLKSQPVTSYLYSDPDALISIFFSSGTTKEPKAIPWTQLMPLKCASDGHFHHDIREDDVVTWTTGMGWMMAPWLIFAGLLNRATISLYVGAATDKGFNRFTEESQVTILGTIPSVVKAWQNRQFHREANWKVRLFSSTGEPSNAADYFYLMALSGFKAPIIEYCGGTEIGGGYITGTLVQPASLSKFTTPALGLDFYLLKEDGSLAEENEAGEVFIIPPSVGLSQRLLNKDHHKEYYEGTPKGPHGETLRRHGDAFEKLLYGGFVFYRSVGRTDDAMNLGGIKISAVEIERVLNNHKGVSETAAIAVSGEGGGPERLVIFVVARTPIGDLAILKKELQTLINQQLNPLFKISDIELIDELPRTASKKVMRKELRRIAGKR
jgi:acetyl-CoA synthetase